MTNITYGISEERYVLNGNSRTSFGVVAYADAQKDGTATIVASVGDITEDRARLADFVEKCNSNGLSTIHLYDAVEDFLADR